MDENLSPSLLSRASSPSYRIISRPPGGIFLSQEHGSFERPDLPNLPGFLKLT